MFHGETPGSGDVVGQVGGWERPGAQTSSTASMAPSETAISVSSLPVGRR
jgi:hypothetical protein